MSELISKSRFNWSEVINFDATAPEGNQILHFLTTDKPYIQDKNAVAFVEQHLKSAQAFAIDAAIMRYASDQVTLQGHYLEMGVCTARTTNFIAALNPDKIIYGFDSFAGLPEPWVGRGDFDIPAGMFAYKDENQLPAVLHNVRLVKGLFEDTLPRFKKEILQDNPIAFIHIDCDLYSSTHSVFQHLGSNMVSGTVILFDELYNYPGFELHEYKALQEFLAETGKSAEYFAYNTCWEQVAVRIK